MLLHKKQYTDKTNNKNILSHQAKSQFTKKRAQTV